MSSLVPIGTVQSGNYFKIQLTGIDPNIYTIVGFGDNAMLPSNGGSYIFSGAGATITLSDFSRQLWVDRLEIYLGTAKVRTIDCYGGTIFNIQYEWLKSDAISIWTIPTSSTKKHLDGNPYYYTSTTESYLQELISAGNQRIYIKVIYGIAAAYSTSLSETFELGYINVHDLVFDKIVINTSSVTKKFYKNGTFSYSGLTVSAYYNYDVEAGGGFACDFPITSGYSVTIPSMTTSGNKTVTVSYGGKTATYTIQVVGVNYATAENTNNNYKHLNELVYTPGLPTSVTIVYTDSTSRSITPSSATFEWLSGDLNTVGTKTWTYKVFDSYTGDWANGTSLKYVRDVVSIAIKTNPTTTTYKTNQTFSTAGLVLTANYGEAGNKDITALSTPIKLSDVAFSIPNMTTIGIKTVTATYRSKSASFNITVNGLSNLRLYVPATLNKHLKGDSVTSITSGMQIFATTTNGGEVEVPHAGNSSFSVAINTSNVNINQNGTYQVLVTVTHEGNSLTASYYVTIYSLESLTLSNYKEEFIYTGSAPTFSIGGLIVIGHFSDGTERALSSAEYIVSPPANMNVGNRIVTISATIGSTVSGTYTIRIEEDFPVSIESVDLTLWNDTFVQGNTFSKSGIKVKASMNSGIVGKEVDFTTSLDGQVFGTDITTATQTFSIYIEAEDPESPIEITYDSNIILSSKTLTAKYDILNSISVNAGNETSSLRLARAGDKFTDYIDETTLIVVTGSYEYGGTKTIARGNYSLSKPINEVWTKENMGNNTITVSFGGKSATYTVLVSKLFAIEVTTSRSPNLYNRYQSFNTSEITVMRRYTHDGEEAEENGVVIAIDKVALSGSYNQLVPDNEDDLTTTIGFSYTEAGVTATASMNVTVIALSSISLSSSKFSVNYGESFSLVGKTITVIFNNEDEFILTIGAGNTITYTLNGSSRTDALSLSLDTPIIKNKVEDVTVGLTFGSETKFATFTIHCVYLDDIALDASYYTGGTLFAGEPVEYEHLSVTKTVVSTDADDTAYPETTDITEDVTFSISDGQLLVVGNNTVTAYYSQGVGNTLQSKSNSVVLSANQITLQSISVDSTEIEKALNSYVEGQSLNLNGIVVNAVFNRTLSNRVVALNECKIYFDDTEKYYTSTVYQGDDAKDLVIAFTYSGVTKTAVVGEFDVVAKQLVSIATRESSTNKLNYLIGDKFSTSGLILDAVYNDGYEEIISSGFTTNYDAYKTTAFTVDSLGTKTVTVSLTISGTTKTTTFDIVIGNPALSTLRFVTTFVNLSVTNATAFSLAGLVVYGVFENGYEEQLEYATPNINTELSISEGKVNFPSNDLGIKNVTISCANPYDELQTAVTKLLQVTVTPNLELVDIRLKFDLNEEPNNYRVGDTFDAKGVTVQALFKDTDWMDISGWETTNPTLGSLIRSGGRLTVKVTYTSLGVVKSAEYIVVVSMPYDSGIVEENTYKVAFDVANITHEEASIDFSDTTQLPLFHSNHIDIDDDEESSTYGLNVYTGINASADCVGYIKLGATSDVGGSVIENGTVVLFDDPVNPIDGDGNIIAKFPHYVTGYADRINKCHFGIIYNNRLFVSGNPDFPNFDWHSSQANASQVDNYDTEEDKDLTYFSDLDYCKYGSENSAVKGYDIYRDGTLLVFKERALHEATIYTRQSQLVNASSFDGTVVNEGELAEEAYPCFPVNPNGGAGAISNYSIINFVGETIVLTRDGLKAITSKESTYNNAKYTYDVSTRINHRLLKKNDLNYSFLSQFKEKLLLRANEGLYIGEYKLRDENSEYEWYFCDNINAYYFFEIDDELYFSDGNGNINRFVNSESIERKDKQRTYVGLGGTTLQIDANNDVIIVSKDYANQVEEGREFHLLNKISAITGNVTDESQVYANMGRFINKNVRQSNIENEVPSFDQTAWEGIIDPDTNQIVLQSYTAEGDEDFTRKEDTLLLFPNNKMVYLDNIVGAVVNVQIDRPYFIKRIHNPDDIFDYRFAIMNEANNEIDLTGIESFRISFRVNNLAVAYIMDVEDYGSDGGKQFKVGLPIKKDEYVPLDLINYHGRNGTYQGVITTRVNVQSYFVTKPFNLDHDLYQKTIHMWSIINDSQIASAMNVGYLVSRKAGDFNLAVKEIGGARQLKFEGFNFDKIHFTNDKLPHIYTRYKTLPNVSFIRFIFSNDEGTRMVLSRLDIIYSYSLLTKGVK